MKPIIDDAGQDKKKGANAYQTQQPQGRSFNGKTLGSSFAGSPRIVGPSKIPAISAKDYNTSNGVYEIQDVDFPQPKGRKTMGVKSKAPNLRKSPSPNYRNSMVK